MQIFAGTSGFAYKSWKGPFYPEDLKDGEMLGHYAERLPTVEINNTFYRLPSTKQLSGWAAQVPSDFRLVIKASRRLTHIKRLKDPDETLPYLLDNVRVLGERLGALFFQLPPSMQRNVERLRIFLAAIPAEFRAAFEFRHPSWFEEEVYSVLRDRDAALCIADTQPDNGFPVVATASWGYLRLRREDYQPEALAAWRARIAAQDWERAFVFFKHEEAGNAPRLAEALMTLTRDS